MSVSKDQKIQTFLDDMKTADYEKYQILQEARKIVFDAASDASERFIYGGIMFSHNDTDIGGVFASKNHVSFEFSQGALFEDPNKHLEGGGKLRRHLKLHSSDGLNKKDANSFVLQALKLTSGI